MRGGRSWGGPGHSEHILIGVLDLCGLVSRPAGFLLAHLCCHPRGLCRLGSAALCGEH